APIHSPRIGAPWPRDIWARCMRSLGLQNWTRNRTMNRAAPSPARRGPSLPLRERDGGSERFEQRLEAGLMSIRHCPMSITYLEAIREAQARALADDPRVFIYGQDVGNFGGAFKATKNLAQEFPGRVLDAPISEDAIVGAAIGAAIEG